MALTKITGEGVGAVDSLSVDGSTIKLDGNYPVGTGNVALGDTALSSGSLSGGNNTAIGDQALYSNTSGAQVTGVGALSLANNSTGIDNTGLGYASLVSNTTGNYNTALGRSALNSSTTASNNTAVGKGSGQSLTTGAGNSFLGVSAGGAITTGSKNVVLGQYNGNQDGVDIRTVSNQIILSDGDGNVRVRLNQSELICAGVYAETTGSGTNMTVLSSGSIRRSTSSLRYKNTVNDATHGLAELLALRPVTYKGNNDGDTVFGGLIAEEVHDAGLTEFVQYDDEGRADALAYGNMVSLCIKAIQEQQETITALEARIAALEGAN